MKKLFFIVCFSLSIVCTFGQSFGGGGNPGGPPPNGEKGQRPPQSNSSNKEQLILEKFPDIPNITLTQREKIGSILTDEHKNISKQLDKKREIEMKSSQSELNQKDLDKQKKNLDKIDKKIDDIQTKSNKKAKKILSDEQYMVFIEKRKSFKFKSTHQGPPNSDRENNHGGRPNNK